MRSHFTSWNKSPYHRTRLIAAAIATATALGLTACSSPTPTASGFNTSDFNQDVRPQDSLFDYVGGAWLKEHEIPSDAARVSPMQIMTDQVTEQVREEINNISSSQPTEGSVDWKLATLYNDYMDEDKVNSLGSEPIQPFINKIKKIRNRTELARLMGEQYRSEISSIFPVYFQPDTHDTTHKVTSMSQGGTRLPAREYYLDAEFQNLRKKYVATIKKQLELADVPEAGKAATNAYNLERQFAEVHWDLEKLNNPNRIYNPYSLDKLVKEAPGFDWNTYFEAIRVPKDKLQRIIVATPSAIIGQAKAMGKASVKQIQDYLTWSVIDSTAGKLSKPFVDESFNFFSKEMNGTQSPAPRWKKGVSFATSAMGPVVGDHYVQKHFSAEAKEQVLQMVEQIKAQYRKQISELDWMTQPTKDQAIKKLDAMAVQVGFPDNYDPADFDGLQVTPGELINNFVRSNDFDIQKAIDSMNSPTDRSDWGSTPAHEVNAFYAPELNMIVIPAGILQSPIFDPNVEPAANFGGIGAIIGHEISHSFDTSGSEFDELGNLRNWWTKKDHETFKQKTIALAKQYDQYESIFAPGHHVNGNLTLLENIADNGGLQAALNTYKANYGDGPTLDNLTAQQRIIYGWSRTWLGKYREPFMIRMLKEDVHSPTDVRSNMVPRNFHAFYDAIGVKEGDKLYTPPDKRVVIWSND